MYGIAPATAEEGFGRAAAHFGLGAAAGIAATLASYPFDVVRTRLVAQGNDRAYAGTVDAAAKMLRAEGARGFFKGLVPTLATVGPYSGLQFGFYALFNQIFDPVLSSGRISMSKSVLCGGLAGLCAKTVVFPFDTTKKRLQVQVKLLEYQVNFLASNSKSVFLGFRPRPSGIRADGLVLRYGRLHGQSLEEGGSRRALQGPDTGTREGCAVDGTELLVLRVVLLYGGAQTCER